MLAFVLLFMLCFFLFCMTVVPFVLFILVWVDWTFRLWRPLCDSFGCGYYYIWRSCGGYVSHLSIDMFGT